MQLKIDQRVWSAIGIAAAGALASLAAADVDPKVTAFAAVGVIILGSLGVHVTAVPKARQEKIVAAATQAPPAPPEPEPGPAPVRPQPKDFGGRGLP